MFSPLFYSKKSLLSMEYSTPEMKKLPLYRLKFLELQKKYHIIDEYTYDTETIKILKENSSKEELVIALIENDFKHNKIDKIERIKRINDAKGKSWVAIHTDYDEENDEDNMQIEVVYNDTFIKNMKKKGLPGDTDDEIAEQWLKLFLISNLDEDDLALVDEPDEENNKKGYVSRTKLDEKKISCWLKRT